ncbi:MAG: hypothetical protein NC489_08290 [Ruminococcus flavefaciens]|nr:hypothetical protein [Ruminococcus flavefaciens]
MKMTIERWVRVNVVPNFRRSVASDSGLMFSLIDPDANLEQLEFDLHVNIDTFNSVMRQHTSVIAERLRTYGQEISTHAEMVRFLSSMTPIPTETVQAEIDALNRLLDTPAVRQACFPELQLMRADITERITPSIVFCDLIAAAYRPQWIVYLETKNAIPGRPVTQLTAKLIAFDPKIGEQFTRINFPTIQKAYDFRYVQDRVSAHLMRILKESNNLGSIQAVYDIMSKYQYYPANEVTLATIKQDIDAYWTDDRIPYYIQTAGTMELEAAVIAPPVNLRYPIHPVYPGIYAEGI